MAINENIRSALQQFHDAHEDQMPDYLSAVRQQVTIPREGGLTAPNFDKTRATLEGMSDSLFRSEMSRLGVSLSSTESASTLRAIAATDDSVRDHFRELNEAAHYARYNQHPGFNELPVIFQMSIFDPAYHRGNGVALSMLARMAERNGLGDFPGIVSCSGTGAIDADPLVMERLLDQHALRHDGKIIPSVLRTELAELGLTVGTDVHIARNSDFTDIDATSNRAINRNSVTITTPYDDRLARAPEGSAERQRWDDMVARVTHATQAMASAFRPEDIARAIEAERQVHFAQITQVEPTNSRYTNGWHNRSRDAAIQVADIYTRMYPNGEPTLVPPVPKVQVATTEIPDVARVAARAAVATVAPTTLPTPLQASHSETVARALLLPRDTAYYGDDARIVAAAIDAHLVSSEHNDADTHFSVYRLLNSQGETISVYMPESRAGKLFDRYIDSGLKRAVRDAEAQGSNIAVLLPQNSNVILAGQGEALDHLIGMMDGDGGLPGGEDRQASIAGILNLNASGERLLYVPKNENLPFGYVPGHVRELEALTPTQIAATTPQDRGTGRG